MAIEPRSYQYLDELVDEATDHWKSIPLEQWDFDRAKAEFMRPFD